MDENIAFEYKNTYYEIFDRCDNLVVELSEFKLVIAINIFIKLDPESPRALFQPVARCIGMIYYLNWSDPNIHWAKDLHLWKTNTV